MSRLLSLVAVLLACGMALPAFAQPRSRTGYEMATDLVDRMVRVTGRQTPGQPGQTGYGLIVGEDTDAQGKTTLTIVVPNHVVRDEATSRDIFQPPTVAFAAEPLRIIQAKLLPEHLVQLLGDIALISVPKPEKFLTPPGIMANAAIVLPGAPGWQLGRIGEFAPDAQPGRFAYQDQSGWVLFEGLQNGRDVTGSAVVGERGVIGIVMGPSLTDPQISRVMPLTYISVRTRAWGHNWSLPLDGSVEATNALQAGPTRYLRSSEPDGIALSPIRIVPMLQNDVTARASWIPPDARVSPWFDVPARLFATPGRDSATGGVLPAGRYLPNSLWRSGAYEVLRKLDGGAWFLVGTSGQELGYVAGTDVVEIWPALATGGLSGGKVVREWTAAAGRPAVLRDVDNAYEIETYGQCQLAACDTVTIFTPAPPAAGAIMPTFQMAPLTGMWHRDDVIAIRILVPRRVIETAGTQLHVCAGPASECKPQVLFPPPGP